MSAPEGMGVSIPIRQPVFVLPLGGAVAQRVARERLRKTGQGAAGATQGWNCLRLCCCDCEE